MRLLFLFVFFASAYPLLALAQFTVSPMTIQTQTDAKTSANGVVTITNTSNKAITLGIVATPFTYNKKGFQILDSSPQDLSSYLIFSPKKMTIQPERSRRIRFNVRFLPSMAHGEYRAMLFAKPVQDNKAGKIGITPQVGVGVYVRHGDIKAQLKVQEAFYQSPKILLLTENTGQATARVKVKWHLYQADSEIAQGRSENKQTVIAQGQRHVKITAPEIKTLAQGRYQIKGQLIWYQNKQEQMIEFQQDFSVEPPSID